MADKKSTNGSKSSAGKSAKTSKPQATKKTTGKSSTKANVNRVVKAAKKYDTDKSFKDNKEAIAGIVTATATSAKRASNKKQKKVFTILLVVLIIAIAAITVYGYYNGWFNTIIYGQGYIGGEVNSKTYDVAAIKNENLAIHFLELGNKYVGDCVYIKAGETDILIDAGSRNDSSSTITQYINQYVTDNKLEYVIATHAHEDHLAGFYSTNKNKGIFESFKTDVIIDFALSAKTYGNNAVGDNTLLGRYLKARDNEIQEGAKHYTAAQCFNETDDAKRVYQLADGIEMEILYNYYYFNYDLNSKGNINTGENNYSVCVMINHTLSNGEVNHYFFSGDLEQEGEKKMVEYYENNNEPLPHCVLYKAGHHGSKTSSCSELMSALSPEYICICTCAGTSEYTKENANQFPTQEFINNVAPYTDKVYVTTMVDFYCDTGWKTKGTVKSMNGNIVFTCKNSGDVAMYFSNNDIKLKDTDWFKEKRTCPDAWKKEQ